MSAPDLGWYARRLSRMTPAEVGWRGTQYARRRRWRGSWPALLAAPGAHRLPAGARRFTATLPTPAADLLDDRRRAAVLAGAGDVLTGRWEVLGVARSDSADPDWFLDPVTGRRAPSVAFAFAVDHRREEVTGNVKQLWELSRLHHLTVLAAAWAVTGDAGYAAAVDRQLRSWWAHNPFLAGVHWTSGIEVGMRLVAWVWIRRLLDGWAGAPALFEANPAALDQLWWHQHYLESFPSRGSSANNHLIVEAAGQLVAALALPWLDGSPQWAEAAADRLTGALEANTFASGLNRELASEYHVFVAELALLAAVEADAAGRPLPPSTWALLAAMLDALAAVVDGTGRPPRQGDGDGAHGLLVAPGEDPVAVVLDAGRRLVGAAAWWPATPPTAAGALIAVVGSAHPAAARAAGPHPGAPAAACTPAPHRRTPPGRRPAHFADAGLTILRTPAGTGPEIWCRCDAGPHGFLSIAAHAHADALAVEVRHGGVDVLADPGTYCYHGEAAWRAYFRSTVAHNTLELAGTDQATSGGPFLWTRHPRSRVLGQSAGDGARQSWQAEHDGYLALVPPAVHRRRVDLDAGERTLRVVDVVDTAGPHPLRLAWHLGPDVDADLDGVGNGARLCWRDRGGVRVGAHLELPAALRWSAVRGATAPVLGWYSPSFGTRVPATTLVGTGVAGPGTGELVTLLRFVEGAAGAG